MSEDSRATIQGEASEPPLPSVSRVRLQPPAARALSGDEARDRVERQSSDPASAVAAVRLPPPVG